MTTETKYYLMQVYTKANSEEQHICHGYQTTLEAAIKDAENAAKTYKCPFDIIKVVETHNGGLIEDLENVVVKRVG